MKKMLFRPEGGDPGAGTPTDAPTDKPTDTPAGDPPTDTWTPPADKAAYDKAISDAVEAVKPKIPEKYDLKLPENAKVDPKLTERTAATARTLGLSQEHAQSALDFINQEINSHVGARVKEITDSYAPGGKGWTETVQKWESEALNDPSVGNGKPEVLAQKKSLATKVAAKFGDEQFVNLLKNDPMGSHPAVVKFLAAIGEAMGEASLVIPTGGPPTEKKASELFYPKTQPA